MKRNALNIFLTLLFATALTALAQSPTTSNMGGSETKAPYGATLDHPNPGSTQAAPGTASTTQSQAPATDTTTPATAPSSTSSTTTDTTTSSMPSSTTDNTSTTTTNTATNGSLPRTASDLPLLVTIGLLAFGAALTVRSIAKRQI